MVMGSLWGGGSAGSSSRWTSRRNCLKGASRRGGYGGLYVLVARSHVVGEAGYSDRR